MTPLSFKEQLVRLGRTRPVDRVSSGSPAVVALRPGPALEAILTISATLALVKRGMSMSKAKLAVEEALDTGRAVVLLPALEDPSILAEDMAATGMSVALVGSDEVDMRSVRERLGLTRDQFAVRYGLDVASVEGWEDGRVAPDRVIRSYLKVIRQMPVQASEALEDALHAARP